MSKGIEPWAHLYVEELEVLKDQRKDLLEACKKVNQCIRCRYGFRQQELNCPDRAAGDLPCAFYEEEYNGLSFVEAAIAKAESKDEAIK
jgi:hypothetical protein